MGENSKKMLNWLGIGILVLLLFSIRAFESQLFYDPFLVYFKNDYLSGPFPEYDGFRLFLGIAMRFAANTLISLAIVYLLFRDKKLLGFASVLYLFFFALLIAAFFVLLNLESQNPFALFYVRRFLIQPIFLLLFVPAFFYQKRISKK